ncbi:MAG: acyltransferase [bacterium]
MADHRQSQLDSLRALSVICVVFVHTRTRGNLLGDLAPLAVALFFVLSGFLITGILLDARARAEAEGAGRGGVLRSFYLRRFLRIFPLYYAVLLVAVLLGEPVTRHYIAELATYRTNFLLARLGNNLAPITPLWSLAVEEHFYVFWPLIALFASRRGLWISMIVMIAGSVVARAVLILNHASHQAIANQTYAALDAIALGCVLAVLWRETTVEGRRPWIFRAMLVGLVAELFRVALFVFPVSHGLAIRQLLNTLPFAMVCVWLVDLAAQDRLANWLRNRWLARLGLVSYAVYVMHRYVMHFLGFDRERGWGVFALVLAATIVLATLSWHFFEGPINRLKRFFPYVPHDSRSRATIPEPIVSGEPSVAQ